MDPIGFLIECLLKRARAALEERKPDLVDMYLLGDTERVEVTYKCICRRGTSDDGMDIKCEQEFRITELPRKKTWRERLGLKAR